MKKNMKGITLVSLVITIIVMLILAGVSIQMATGDNGVLNRGQQGAVKTKLAGIMEELNNSVLSLETDFRSEYIEESSMQARKADYFTIGTVGTIPATSNYINNHKGMNDYLTSCKILTTGAINDANDVGLREKDKSSNTTVLATLAGMKSDASNKKNYTTSKNYETNCGYTLSALYLSNDRDATKVGGDIYVALFYMKDSVPTFVDVGIIEITGFFIHGQSEVYQSRKGNLAIWNFKSASSGEAMCKGGISWLYQSECKNN